MNKQKGFILIELMIIVCIIGIIGVVLITALSGTSGAKSACIGGYLHTVDIRGIAHQTISEHGGGIPCQ